MRWKLMPRRQLISVKSEEDIVLHVDDVRVEQVNSFTYLGSFLTKIGGVRKRYGDE